MGASGWAARSAQDREAVLERLRGLVAGAAVTVASPEHEVVVTVGPGGALTGLHLATVALRRDPGELGELVVATIARATERLATELGAELGELTGGRGYGGAVAGTLPEAPPWASITPAGAGLSPAWDDLAGPDEPSEPGLDAHLDEVRHGARDQLRRYAEARAELAAATTTVASPEHGVAVTVRTGGGVTAVELQPSAREQGPPALAAAIVATVNRARAEAALVLAERLQAVAGPRLDLRGLVEAAIGPQLLGQLHDDGAGHRREEDGHVPD